MTPDVMGDAVIALTISSAYLFILVVGCLIADFVFPHSPFIERFLDSLPDWEDEY